MLQNHRLKKLCQMQLKSSYLVQGTTMLKRLTYFLFTNTNQVVYSYQKLTETQNKTGNMEIQIIWALNPIPVKTMLLEQMIYMKMMMTMTEWHQDLVHILIQNRAQPSKLKMYLKDSSSLAQRWKDSMTRSKVNKKFQAILDLVHILYQWVLLIKIKEIQTTYPSKVVIIDLLIWKILKYQDQDLIRTRPWLSNYKINHGESRECLVQLKKDLSKPRYSKYQVQVSTNLKDRLILLIKRKILT